MASSDKPQRGCPKRAELPGVNINTGAHSINIERASPRGRHGLKKRTRRSTQVCKARTCVRTCEGWPNGFASRLASSRKSQTGLKFHAHIVDLRSTCVDLRWVAKRWKTCVDLRTSLSSTKVNASRRKSTQVGSQTKRKLNASQKLASTCESVWPRLKSRNYTKNTNYSVTWRAQSACVKIDLLRSLLQTRKPNVQIRPRFLANTTRRKKQKKSKPNHVMTWFPD